MMRVQNIDVSQTRRRWLINVVLILAVFAFVGFSFFPVFSAAFKQNSPAPIKTGSSGQEAVTNLQNQLQERAKNYQIVLQREPDNQNVLNEYVTIQLTLGQIYVQEKRYEDAIAVYDQASQVNKKDFRPLLAKGIVLQLQGKTKEAKSQYAAATKLVPPDYKDEIKAQIQQLEARMTAPTSSSPNTPANGKETEPSSAVKEATPSNDPSSAPSPASPGNSLPAPESSAPKN